MRYVPTEEFAPVLRRLLASYDAQSHSLVEEAAGIGFNTIDTILRQRRPGCDFNIADRLLCALGAQHLWWGELAHIYYAIELERECGHCGKAFEPRGHSLMKFCSDTCRSKQAKKRWLAARRELDRMREAA